jgi:hypothetical protein
VRRCIKRFHHLLLAAQRVCGALSYNKLIPASAVPPSDHPIAAASFIFREQYSLPHADVTIVRTQSPT